MLNLKTVIELDVETVYDIFNAFQDGFEVVEAEPVAIITEEETYVIMTADDFHHLQNESKEREEHHTFMDMLELLEILDVEELEHMIDLAKSHINIRMAKRYFTR